MSAEAQLVPVGEEHIPTPTWAPVDFQERLAALRDRRQGVSVQKYNRRMQAGVKNLFGTIVNDDLILSYQPTVKQETLRARDIWRIDFGRSAKARWMPESDLSDGEAKSLIVITFRTSRDATHGPQWRLRCQTTTVRRELVELLAFFVPLARSVASIPVVHTTIIRVWFAADVDFSGGITSEELLEGFRRRHIAADEGFVQELFRHFDRNDVKPGRNTQLHELHLPVSCFDDAADDDDDHSDDDASDTSGTVRDNVPQGSADAQTEEEENVPQIDFNEFTELARGLFATPAPAVQLIVDRYATGHLDQDFTDTGAEPFKPEQSWVRSTERLFTVSDLVRFYSAAQGEPITDSVAARRMLVINDGRSNELLSSDDFFAFVMNPAVNSWMRPEHERVFMDMEQPLHHYFIASSAFSCLNVVDDSSAKPSLSCAVEWVVAAMARGVRSIELQVADNDALGVPCIVGADTDVSTCTLDDVLAAVAEHAFEATPFPLVLHLDLRTSINGSAYVAASLRTRLARVLFTPKDMAALYRSGDVFSPAKLSRRVLVSCCTDDKVAVKILSTLDGVNGKTHHAAGVGLDALRKLVALQVYPHDGSTWGTSFEETEVAPFMLEDLAPSYQPDAPAMAKRQAQWIEYGRKALLRGVPDSPLTGNSTCDLTMSHGVQFAGMNLHIGDGAGREYERLFETLNGGSGYLLKPMFMRRARMQPDDTTFKFAVAVIQGMHMPRPPELPSTAGLAHGTASTAPIPSGRSPEAVTIDAPETAAVPEGKFQVSVTISGCSGVRTADDAADVADPRFEWLQTKDSLSYCPTFNSVELGTRELRLRGVDLAIITLRLDYVSESAQLPVAEASVPLRSLRVGYRAVPLWDATTNERLPASM
eukprot:CAMPEP_0174839910 /NCGR_PEP_ID=MMETSP1114-20130205/8345_1 /TAXON_ID=312471 /ORGANISM="Neobodo designis, Strain CCAP 1951/1" /LENGTH=877 /DNA_ID=CAMNT_0016074039 /DNA_START=27 /DNA_END=2657 /DNA_ORIENTATION=+